MAALHSTLAEPPEIRLRLKSLDNQGKIIADLTVRLEEAQLEYSRLETELGRYRASIAPIQKCPEEVLITTFEFFSGNSPEVATELLPVCKAWYAIAVNAPQLWTRINIKAKATWNQQKEALKNNMRIQTCLTRSAMLPLHVTIHLENMLLGTRVAPNFLLDYKETTCSEPLCGIIKDSIKSLGLGDTIGSHICKASVSNCMLQSISSLVGERGRHMKRWETLSLTLPRERIEEVWQLFSFPAPNLAKLIIEGYLAGRSRSFKHLSSLEELGLGGADLFNLDFLGMNFHSIKRLQLRASLADQHQPTSIQLSRFTNLEHLAAHTSRFASQRRREFTSTEVIHLPHLKTLTLKLCKFHRIEWRVPVLQKLTFEGSQLDEPLEVLPDVQTSCVYWVTGATSYKPHAGPVLRRSLEGVVSKYRDAQKLTLPVFLQPIWDEFYQDLKEEERVRLPMVVFERDPVNALEQD